MAFSLIGRTTAASSSGVSVTTTGFDTSGANLLIIVSTGFGTITPPLSDSKSNTWTNAAVKITGSAVSTVIAYAYNPGAKVGASHTFQSCNGVGDVGYPSIAVYAFSGATTTDPIDQSSTASGSGVVTIQAGSVTPAEDNELLIAAVGWSSLTAAESIDLSFDATNTLSRYGAGTNLGTAGAYLIEGSAAAKNPAWSWTNALDATGLIATFKAAATSTPPAPNSTDDLVTVSENSTNPVKLSLYVPMMKIS